MKQIILLILMTIKNLLEMEREQLDIQKNVYIVENHQIPMNYLLK